MAMIDKFETRLNKCGIDITFGYNFPWIYIESINGVRVTEKFLSKHGFTVAFSPKKIYEVEKFTDISKTFKLIRKYICIMEKIPINIWDDYNDYDDDETYAYVEDHKMDYDLRYKHLEEFSVLFLEATKGSAIEIELVGYDSRSRYSNLPESMHFTRPELRIKNMNHEQREALVQQLQSLESNFDVYSES